VNLRKGIGREYSFANKLTQFWERRRLFRPDKHSVNSIQRRLWLQLFVTFEDTRREVPGVGRHITGLNEGVGGHLGTLEGSSLGIRRKFIANAS
jgi:hypothetical protein